MQLEMQGAGARGGGRRQKHQAGSNTRNEKPLGGTPVVPRSTGGHQSPAVGGRRWLSEGCD